MIQKTLKLIALMVSVLAWHVPSTAWAEDSGAALNPHRREGCLKCHRGVRPTGTGRTLIFTPGKDGPHAVLVHSCQTCHKEGKEDFWILVLPTSEGLAPSEGPVEREETAPLITTGVGEQEGFKNSHDSMDCTNCHEGTPEELQKGISAPARFGPEGVRVFCRRCHSGVDQSHFPRENYPRTGITCLNCHQVHGQTLLYPALLEEYPQFLTEAVDINPHGGKIFCLTCHLDSPQGGQPVNFRYPDDAIQLCRRCHSGVEHHPLGVKSNPGTWKMDFSNFPLQREAITCVTCHDPYECEGVVFKDNPRFLRGGPYNAVEEFCQRCHEGRRFTNLNPHDQVDEGGAVNRKKCLYCHVSVPDGTYASLTEQDFTDDLQALCASCHPMPPHPDIDHMVPLPVEMQANVRGYEERRLVTLPLDGEDRVTCVTCHNPHEKGLLVGPAGVGADEEHRLRLTTFNEICTPCHGRH